MSSPSIHPDAVSDASEAASDSKLSSLVAAAHDRIAEPARIVGFWSAIALPFLYVPLLATGLETVAETVVFLALLGANVLAIALGHSYSPGRD